MDQKKQYNLDFHKYKEEVSKRVRGEISYHIFKNLEDKKENTDKNDKNNSRKFYKDLEYDHSYIQWIFPNFFFSMFNPDSYRLTIQERNQMIQDKKVMEFYISNFKMFLNFLGIDWGEEELRFNNKQQFKLCLYTNTHNQLRLKRIFASLSVLGHRKEAIKFLDFIFLNENKLYRTQYYYFDLVKEEEKKQSDISEENKEENHKQMQNIQIQQIENSDVEKQNAPHEQNNSDNQKGQKEELISETGQIDLIEDIQKKDQIEKALIIPNLNQVIDNNKVQANKIKNPIKEESYPQSKYAIAPKQDGHNKRNLQKPVFLVQPEKDKKFQYKFHFDEVKNYYVQEDLLKNSWVSIKLLTDEQCETQSR